MKAKTTRLSKSNLDVGLLTLFSLLPTYNYAGRTPTILSCFFFLLILCYLSCSVGSGCPGSTSSSIADLLETHTTWFLRKSSSVSLNGKNVSLNVTSLEIVVFLFPDSRQSTLYPFTPLG